MAWWRRAGGGEWGPVSRERERAQWWEYPRAKGADEADGAIQADWNAGRIWRGSGVAAAAELLPGGAPVARAGTRREAAQPGDGLIVRNEIAPLKESRLGDGGSAH